MYVVQKILGARKWEEEKFEFHNDDVSRKNIVAETNLSDKYLGNTVERTSIISAFLSWN